MLKVCQKVNLMYIVQTSIPKGVDHNYLLSIPISSVKISYITHACEYFD